MESTAQRTGVRELLEAGVHFGHQAKRWNPKMKRYIFAQRAGIHVIDLDQTVTLLERALRFIRGVSEAKRDVLFVGTKKQAQVTVADQAVRSGQPYVAERYIGGMLTNFQTIRPRIDHFVELKATVEETPEENRTGRDWFAIDKEYQKLRRNYAGLTDMERVPGAVFVVDPKREELIVKEANRLKIPVVAITDTNCDPDVIDYVIPGNDDAIRSINLISRLVADTVLEGRGEGGVEAEDRPLPPSVAEAVVSPDLTEDLPMEEPVANGEANGEASNEAVGETAPSAEAEEVSEAPAAQTEAPGTPEEEPADAEPVIEAAEAVAEGDEPAGGEEVGAEDAPGAGEADVEDDEVEDAEADGEADQVEEDAEAGEAPEESEAPAGEVEAQDTADEEEER